MSSRKRGPLTTADFAHHSHSVDWWWAPTRASRAILEALFVSGRVGIARREGNRRYYDLIERLVPPEILAVTETDELAAKHRLLFALSLDRPQQARRRQRRDDRHGFRRGSETPHG